MRATRSIFGKTRCPNRVCRFFDASLMNRLTLEGTYRPASSEVRGPSEPATTAARHRGTGFSPVERIEIRYRNFEGVHRVFVGDATTLRRRRQHYSVCVMPTGRRITLAAGRIENLEEVRRCVIEHPTPREEHVLRYHSQRGTTSELFERLRAKYPGWQPAP